MKKLPTIINSTFILNNITYFITLKIFEINFRVSTLPFDVTIDSEIYSYNSKIIAIDPPSSSSVIDRAAYKVQLSDVDLAFKEYFETSALGSRLQVKLGVYDNSSGLPNLVNSNLLTIYDGIIDSTIIEANPREGSLIATIESSSPLASLEKRNTFYSSKRYLRDIYPIDSSFDFVHVGSGNSILKWGKA